MHDLVEASAVLICYGCNTFKADECFHKDSSRAERRSRTGKCKECKKVYLKGRPRNIEYEEMYYQKNKEVMKAHMKVWRASNGDRMLAYWHNYKAKLKDNGPYDKDITRYKLYDRDKGICQLCNLPVTRQESSIDHCKPVSKGGTHTWDNVQIAHRTCNVQKGAKYDGNDT